MTPLRRDPPPSASLNYRPRRVEKLAPCGAGCPNDADIRGWLGFLSQREPLGLSREEALRQAWTALVEWNPLPATIGRICPHPCEAGCNRARLEGPVQINRLEQFLGDWALARGLLLPLKDTEGATYPVAVVGAGPAGLSAAYQLARRGHAVTMYDRHLRPGGMLRHAIPDFRLPPAVVDAEIDRILRLGVEFRPRCVIGRDITPGELRDGYAAVFVAIGAQQGRPLRLEDDRGREVRTGIDYLQSVKEGKTAWCGQRVVVVGGGNTAVDAARTARRAGSEVTLLYRRGRAEMPAFGDEVDDALDDGVRLETLAVPVRIERDSDRITGLVIRRVRLGEPDGSGRRRPIPIPGSEVRIECDAVLAAIAQEVDWDRLDDLKDGGLDADPDGRLATAPVWAGGDMMGPGIASRAIGEGRRAAEAIHAALTGSERERERSRGSADAGMVVKLGAYEPREPMALGSLSSGSTPDGELDLDVERALREAGRCLSCGLCFGCQRCWMYCSARCFEHAESPRPGEYFVMDLASCEACGKCVDVCPCGFLEFELGPEATTFGFADSLEPEGLARP